ncbi:MULTISPECIES: ABC transporter substrate-binding protein [unclassified Nonomuraea]|uniref:ABC transporter substrate-binding protein n=1 Tax=unclassified Nonomuraea TaxID=2593643 RepID=UPI00191C4EC4|nr:MULTISPECIES: ABC transporter substrate-binding protein [unclassified Nonomuraea]
MATRGLLIAVVMVLAAACTAGVQSPPAGGARTDTIVFGKTDAGTTYTRNYNVVGPATQKTPNAEMIYEPLARIDYSDGGTVKPWLAESLEFDEKGTRLTIKVRQGVTFSDGAPLTVDDVVFSLRLPLEEADFNLAGTTYEDVEKVDGSTVAVTFGEPGFSEINQFASPSLPMVPKKIWEKQDLNAWTNPDPVGTGPFVLESFAAQQITLRARDDYWGGSLPMKYLKIIPTNQDAVKAQLLRGEVDWAIQSWPGAEQEYVAKDPQKHLYQLYATGGAYSMLYNTARPPFDDVHVRRALAMTIPRGDIVTTLNRPGTEAGPTGLVDLVYRDWLKPEYRGKVQQVDAEGARRELAEGGWTVTGGKLVKDGESYTPSLSFNQDFGWAPYADIMINSWKSALGLQVKSAGAPGANLYDSQQLGTFDLTIATVGGAGVSGVYSMLAGRAVRPIGKKAATNLGRWKDTRTDAVLADLLGTSDTARLKQLAQDMQTIVVDQVPFSPIYNSYWFVAINAGRWTGWPTPEKFSYVPFPNLGPDTTLTLMNLKRAAP